MLFRYDLREESTKFQVCVAFSLARSAVTKPQTNRPTGTFTSENRIFFDQLLTSRGFLYFQVFKVEDRVSIRIHIQFNSIKLPLIKHLVSS